MIAKIKNDAKERMQKSSDSLKTTLAKLRTGRARPGLIENIKVDYYGTETPLNQVANVSVADARTLQITPWDKSAVQAIEKAIMTSDLGLNPATAGEIIRVPLPPLTEERRKDMIKVVRNEAENARIAIRNIRRDANGQIKELLKAKEISEDEEHQYESEIQKMTDEYIKSVDSLLSSKEEELMEI